MRILGKPQAVTIGAIAGALFAGTAFFIFCQAAVAQRELSARIEWYGIYTTSTMKEIDDPGSPTGKRFVVTPVPAKSNTDRIPGRDDVKFGLSYMLSADAVNRVRVRELYIFPSGGMPDESGKRRATYESARLVDVGSSHLMGWSFESAPAERIVLGVWTYQVWQGDQKLIEQTFNVFRP